MSDDLWSTNGNCDSFSLRRAALTSINNTMTNYIKTDTVVVSSTQASSEDEEDIEMLSTVYCAMTRRLSGRQKSRSSSNIRSSSSSFTDIDPVVMSKRLSSTHPEYDVTSRADVVNGNGHVEVPESASPINIVVTSPDTVPDADGDMANSQKSSKEFMGKSRSVGSSVHGRQKISSRRSESKLTSNREHTSKKERRLQSQNEQFSRLFSDVNDALLNSFHCALVQDILIQGVLYVTQHWFCFHSKLFGKKPSIKILVTDVVNITKMKTAGIIPNAIGLETRTDKFTFGSLMARQATYRLLVDIWKTETGTSPNCTDVSYNVGAIPDKTTPDAQDIVTSENDSSSLNSTDGDESNSKIVNTSDVFAPNTIRSERSTMLSSPPSDSGSKSVESPSLPHNGISQTLDISPHSDHSDRSMATDDTPSLRGHMTGRELHSSSQPVIFRSVYLMLLIATAFLLLCLLFLTVILAFKVVRLQTLVEVSLDQYTQTANTAPSNGCSLRYSDGRMINVNQLNAMLNSHRRLIEQVNHSLVGLTDLTNGICLSLQTADVKSTT